MLRPFLLLREERYMDETKRSTGPLLVLLTLLIISAVAHGSNMFRFPYYENDEGTYMSRAWSLVTEGELAPTTYTYDHAPAGWMLLALWSELSGGFFAFGSVINSGRALMLGLHLLSVVLLFDIARSLSKSSFAASIAVLIFSLSPLAVYFQRRVLLDNIMVFWLLLAIDMVIKDERRLTHYVLGAIAFGLAVLSKESAAFLFPALLYIVITNSNKKHRNFAVALWLTAFLSVLSYYILFALLKGEFFPAGTALGGTTPHVSLLVTVRDQLVRTGGFFLDPQSTFQQFLREWRGGGSFENVPDAPLIIGGAIATVAIVGLSLNDQRLRYVALLVLSYWAFLMSGYEVIALYVIPLVPLLALAIAFSIHKIGEMVSGSSSVSWARLVVAGIALFPFVRYYMVQPANYITDQTTQQVMAIQWIDANIPDGSVMLIDNYAYVDLRAASRASNRAYDHVYYYWTAETDSSIKTGVLADNWQTVRYVLMTPQMSLDATQAGLSLTASAIENSAPLQTFSNNGWDVEIREVTP